MVLSLCFIFLNLTQLWENIAIKSIPFPTVPLSSLNWEGHNNRVETCRRWESLQYYFQERPEERTHLQEKSEAFQEVAYMLFSVSGNCFELQIRRHYEYCYNHHITTTAPWNKAVQGPLIHLQTSYVTLRPNQQLFRKAKLLFWRCFGHVALLFLRPGWLSFHSTHTGR